jgi:HTH-type transcriptional regulator/antitoxin HigA
MATKGKARVDLYLKLVRALPLRPIRSEADLERATAMIDALSDRSRLTADERDYWTVLARLIEDYETERHPIPDAPAGDVLRHLIEARGATQAQVAEDTGIAMSSLNEMIKHKRGVSPRNIVTLARYFNVSPTVFLPEGQALKPAKTRDRATAPRRGLIPVR